ncbi:hypothetical protein GCM10007301_24020 [Azorhizobium oxalatiphilum]|uniref:DUF1795 domain-containing protein n=1 Tax=Azorhizobium oxalatiphilum TaxID=980631 RepID=A0A917C1F1_9HYPH|nr:DUF4946 domain-containing protein [Azorhizobium oxalatiphilum]GGF63400.1 hypothetical protein GCM10007301_24020 [Azorhizobium oxalatiphilum]
MRESVSRCHMWAAGLSAGLVLSTAAWAEPGITWPEGWEPKAISVPVQPEGAKITNLTAIRTTPERNVEGMISFSILTYESGEAAELEEEAQAIQQVYAHRPASEQVECGAFEPAMLAGLPARRMSCVTRPGRPVLRTHVMVVVKGAVRATLIFAAPPKAYEESRLVFEAVEKSLRF